MIKSNNGFLDVWLNLKHGVFGQGLGGHFLYWFDPANDFKSLTKDDD